MIILKLGTANNNFSNNYLTRNKHKFYLQFLFSLINYFQNNLENVYFLILSLFQVCTSDFINLIPKNYSPTGPWSTFIPLLLCICLQIISDYVSWFYQFFQDKSENQRKITYFYNNKWSSIASGKLRPGNIIYLKKDDVVPIDGIVMSIRILFSIT